MRVKLRSTVALIFALATFLLLSNLLFEKGDVMGVRSLAKYDVMPQWLRLQASSSDTSSSLSCQQYVCRKGLCFENMMCHAPIPDFLSNYKNPCFYETTTATATDQSIFTNLLTMYMLSDKTSPVAKAMEKMWTGKKEKPVQLRCLPYFFIIGMEKCGTTDLYSRLTRHPKIIGTPTKEIQWWTRRRFVVKWDGQVPKNLQSDNMKFKFYSNLTGVPFNHYYAFFDKPSERIEAEVVERNETLYHDVITVDSSANSMYWHDFAEIYGDISADGPDQTTAQHIAATIPMARLVVSLRDPTQRLYSSYLFFNGDVSSEKFHNKVLTALKLFQACTESKSVRACAYDRELKDSIDSSMNLMQGLYVVFLKDWLRVFPKQQLHIIHFESYKKNELFELNKVLEFLDVETLAEDSEMAKKVLAGKIAYQGSKYEKVGAMWNVTVRLLNDFYRKYNEDLAVFLEDDRFLWHASADS